MVKYWRVVARRVRSNQAGFSLVELLIASSILIVVLGATLSVLVVAERQQPRITKHGERVQDARNALERMTRDLRQSYSVTAESSASIDVLTYRRTSPNQPAQQWRVVYDCTGGDCLRQEGAPTGALGAAVTLFTGVTNADIFTFQPSNVNPHFVTIKLRFGVKANSTDPASPVTLSDGVQLRNVSVPG